MASSVSDDTDDDDGEIIVFRSTSTAATRQASPPPPAPAPRTLSVSQLQMMCTRQGLQLDDPEFRKSGPDHMPVYTCTWCARDDGTNRHWIGRAQHGTKKQARLLAATDLYRTLVHTTARPINDIGRTELQQYCQRNGLPQPQFYVERSIVSGYHFARCSVGEIRSVRCRAPTKKAAQSLACASVFAQLNDHNENDDDETKHDVFCDQLEQAASQRRELAERIREDIDDDADTQISILKLLGSSETDPMTVHQICTALGLNRQKHKRRINRLLKNMTDATILERFVPDYKGRPVYRLL